MSTDDTSMCQCIRRGATGFHICDSRELSVDQHFVSFIVRVAVPQRRAGTQVPSFSSSLLHSKGLWIFQASLAIGSRTSMIRESVLMAPVYGAVIIETAQVTVLQVQEKLGALLETLGLSNVCCCQATGVPQAA